MEKKEQGKSISQGSPPSTAQAFQLPTNRGNRLYLIFPEAAFAVSPTSSSISW
jgi:hypothetical protein